MAEEMEHQTANADTHGKQAEPAVNAANPEHFSKGIHIREMVKPQFRGYLYGALALFLSLGLTLLLFFLIDRMPAVKTFFKEMLNVAMPFLVAAVIAYLLHPLCNWLDNLWMKLFKVSKDGSKAARNIRCVDAIICVLLLIGVVYVLVAMVIPQLAGTVSSLISLFESVPGWYEKFLSWIQKIFKDQPKVLEYIDTYSATVYSYASEFFTDHIMPYTTTAIGSVGGGVKTAFSVVKNIVIGLVVSVYLLVARKRFKQQAILCVHGIFTDRVADKIFAETRYIDKVFSGYVNGKIIDSIIIGILCFIGCMILKFPYPGLIAVVIGVTNVIPFFGPIIGAIPTAFIILLISPMKCLWFLIFILALQQLDGNVIGPFVLGDSTGLSSFWVLFAIIIFSGWFGFVGMVIGVPLFAVVYHFISEIIYFGLRKHGKEEMLLNYLWEFDPAQAKYEDSATREEALAEENRPHKELVKENLNRQREQAKRILKRKNSEAAEETESAADEASQQEEIEAPGKHRVGNRRRKPQ